MTYLKLLNKYFDKNKNGLTEGINYKRSYQKHGLVRVLKLDEQIKTMKEKYEFFKFYLYLSDKCKVIIDKKALKGAMECITKDEEFRQGNEMKDQFLSCLSEYIKRNDISLENISNEDDDSESDS